MKKILLILAVISFALPIFFYHWATVTYRDDSINYFVEMYDIMHHHLFIEGGFHIFGINNFPFYLFGFGVICLVILVIPRKWIDYVLDEISFYRWKRMDCGGCDVDDKETL